jgi:hypothetical protein
MACVNVSISACTWALASSTTSPCLTSPDHAYQHVSCLNALGERASEREREREKVSERERK